MDQPDALQRAQKGPKGAVVHVTATNHQWAAIVTGQGLEEIKRRYAESEARGEVCAVEVKP